MKSISRAKAQRHKGRRNPSTDYTERKSVKSVDGLRLSLRFSPRLCAFAGVLFLFAFCVIGQSQITDTRGLTELKKGDYDNAFMLLNARLAANPNDHPAQRALLRVYIETGRYAEAEAAARKFLAKTPETASVRHELAEALAITGRHTEAIVEFERAGADSEKSDNALGDKLASDLRRAELL